MSTVEHLHIAAYITFSTSGETWSKAPAPFNWEKLAKVVQIPSLETQTIGSDTSTPKQVVKMIIKQYFIIVI